MRSRIRARPAKRRSGREVAHDGRGREVLDVVREAGAARSPISFGGLVARSAAERQLETGKAWLRAHDFLRALDRARLLSDTPFTGEPYPGRAALVKPDGLRELWLQVNDA